MTPGLEAFSQELRPYQRALVDDALAHVDRVANLPDEADPRARRVLYSMPTGCHAYGEMVLLWGGGEIAAQDVTVGTLLAGIDGPRPVEELHRGHGPMARISPVKGEPFVVNLEHILTLRWIAQPPNGCGEAGELVDVSVREWLDWPTSRKHIAKLVRSPGVWDLLPELRISPYLLGVLLGDGCLTAETPVIACSDPDVARAVEALAPAHGVGFARVDVGGKYRLRLSAGASRWSPNPLMESIRHYGLNVSAEWKRVPAEYLRAGAGVRAELLAGLIDTDGHLSNGGYDWISKSPLLADAVVRLARSLGLAAYMRPALKYSQLGSGGTYYRVSITGDCNVIPCVGRKKAPERRQKKNVLHTGFGVEILPSADYYGWTVGGDHRYLMADYTLTHNSGKGSCQLHILRTLRADGLDAWIYTPTHEVLRGYLERCGFDPTDASRDALIEMGRAIYCTTPTTARNRIIKGLDVPPDVILYDEVHHATEGNEVSGDIFGMAQLSAWLGFTATPFRGSPRGTIELQKAWPDQVEVLNIPEAVAGGYWSLPTFEVVGLVDDDAVKIAGGDFQASAVTKKMRTRIDDLASLTHLRNSARRIPTAVVVPSREVAGLLVEALDRISPGSAIMVDGDTPARARGAAYTLCREMSAVLVAVQVISEGVDFPWLRRIIDARPTLSPVSWIQLLGRITRPGPERPEYITVCRNLERHAYLLGGLVPRSVVKAAQEEFGKPSKRAGHRSVGLEALNRFKPISIPLLDGVRGTMFLVYSVDKATGQTRKWCTVLDPTAERTITGVCTHVQGPDGQPRYGSWEAAELPEDLTGFATSQNKMPMSDKMKQWWERAAHRYGLDNAARVTRRQFEALPLLRDLRQSIGAVPVLEA